MKWDVCNNSKGFIGIHCLPHLGQKKQVNEKLYSDLQSAKKKFLYFIFIYSLN